ncbi:MAG TPA: S41 family peptidase [Bryobacteraceae bacterium]|nr:S41 family peptidase [Bryobacteraceae bacterium]
MLAWRKIFPVLLYTLPALGQLTPEQQKANLESFEIVWQTVRDHHPDPKLNGLDWRAIYYKTKPIIAKCHSMNEMRSILRDMLARLDTSHYSIIPADAYSSIDESASSRDASPGFETAVIDGKAIVTGVDSGSPADRAGIRPGMVVADINGTKVAPLLDALRQAKAPEADALAARSIQRSLAGPANSTVAVDLVDAQGTQQHVEVPRSASAGDLVAFANLPPMRVTLESRRLESGVGYLRLNVFLDPARIMPEFEAALKRFDATPGVILDLRGNPGGIGVMAMGIAGFFIDQDGLKLGEMKTRDLTMKFAVFPRPHPYRGKLAILVDGGSASTSEILAEGLRDLGRARIFGSRTAGAALPSDIIRLPNGDGFQYAQASYVSAKGRVLEGNGVIPDVEVHRTVADVKTGSDPAVDAAARWIAAR